MIKVIELPRNLQFIAMWSYTTTEYFSCPYYSIDTEHIVTQKAKYLIVELRKDKTVFNWNILDEERITIRCCHCRKEILALYPIIKNLIEKLQEN